jgi:hypothetical protein
VVTLKKSIDRRLLLTRKLLNKGFIVDFNLTTRNPLFSSFLVSSNPLSSDYFNLTTRNLLFSSFLVSSITLSSDYFNLNKEAIELRVPSG